MSICLGVIDKKTNTNHLLTSGQGVMEKGEVKEHGNKCDIERNVTDVIKGFFKQNKAEALLDIASKMSLLFIFICSHLGYEHE